MANITLLQVNDLHGYLEPHPELFELTPGAPWRSGGGIARIASLFKAVRHETGGAVIALGNGDTFHGTMPAVQTQGMALVQPVSGERVQEMRVDGARLRADAEYAVALLGEQAVPSKYGSNRRDTGVTAVDALKQYVMSRDVVESAMMGRVVLV